MTTTIQLTDEQLLEMHEAMINECMEAHDSYDEEELPDLYNITQEEYDSYDEEQKTEKRCLWIQHAYDSIPEEERLSMIGIETA